MPLETCLARALDGLKPVPAEWAETGAALGLVLAEDLCLPQDMPPACEALRADLAVAALDLVGASAGSPIPLWNPVRVVPGEALPSGMDAVLPEDGTDTVAGCPEAVQPVSPGEGVRRTGHDGRADTLIARAGTRLAPRHSLIATQARIARIALRQPRVARVLDDAAQLAFAQSWFAGLGACVADGPADLTLRPTTDQTPRLALAPAETAWLARMDAAKTGPIPEGALARQCRSRLPPLAESLSPGTEANVTLFATTITPPRLTIVGSHCIGLDAVVGRLADAGVSARILATGSQGGLSARR